MKMIKVEELHKEANGNSYTRSTYMVGRYEVCIDDAAYADGTNPDFDEAGDCSVVVG